MKIIILRHAGRYKSPTYLTPLTVEGLEQADILKESLPSDIDYIYCSPFLRTLQTIYPYCLKYNKKVNTENVFYERCMSPYFNYHNYRNSTIGLKESWNYATDIINKDYKSKWFVSNIKLNPTDQDIQNRVFSFIYRLCKKYKNTDKTFLICSHSSICNAVKKVFNKNTTLRDEFPMGHFEEVSIDDSWKGINL